MKNILKNQKNFPFICSFVFIFIMLISVTFQNYGASFIQTGINDVFNPPKATLNNSNTADNATADTTKSDNTNSNPANESESEPAVKKIALTFDDGPHPKYTMKLLDGLAERNVKVTFFVLGERASNYPDILKRMNEDGHLIGNHTYSHVQLSCISKEKAILEINNTNYIIKEATGYIPKYIRPPYGSLPSSLKSETNLTPVLWTIDPRDWSVLNTDSVVKHVVKRAKDGDIILLHDIFETSVDAALIIIDKLQQEGFEFVTIDELT